MTNVCSTIPVSPSVSSADDKDGGDPDAETPIAQTYASKVISSTPTTHVDDLLPTTRRITRD